MSLVSTVVVMSDGKYYKNPRIEDETKRWFICFDDDDPPEFVLQKDYISTICEKKEDRKIDIILKRLGIVADVISCSMGAGQRVFRSQHDEFTSFLPAISAFLKFDKRIPVDKFKIEADEITDELEEIQCVVYDPEFVSCNG